MSPDFIPAAKPLIGEEEVEAVSAVLRSGMVAQGPQVAMFEEEFAEQASAGTRAVAVNSGTSALHLGLLASGIGPGDQVIVPSFTFAATANSVALTGATPVFVDIEPNYFTLDPEAVNAAITDRTAGILAVHLYGHPAAMEELGEIAQRHELALFEDAAQAHGALYGGKQVGTFGRFAAFSFYPTKNMTAGEGGMVTTSDPELERRVRLLRNQGMQKQYENELVGVNNRMTDIHAAIGRVQLGKLEGWNAARQRNAAFLNKNLRGVITPKVAPEAEHVYHQYTIRVPAEERDRIVQALREEFGVGSGVYYPLPNHRLPSLSQFAAGVELPETEAACQQVISLPVHPSLEESDLERIVSAVNQVVGA